MTDINKELFRMIADDFFEGGNCDSKCRNCKQSESLGNVIKTEPQDDESVIRSCSNCGHTWRAIFTPVGFVEVE